MNYELVLNVDREDTQPGDARAWLEHGNWTSMCGDTEIELDGSDRGSWRARFVAPGADWVVLRVRLTAQLGTVWSVQVRCAADGREIVTDADVTSLPSEWLIFSLHARPTSNHPILGSAEETGRPQSSP